MNSPRQALLITVTLMSFELIAFPIIVVLSTVRELVGGGEAQRKIKKTVGPSFRRYF